MNLKTFKEANQLFKGGLIRVIHSTLKSAIFNVITYDDIEHQVVVTNKGYLKIMCDCDYNGRKGEAVGGLCKHKLAVIKELIRLDGKV